MLPVDSGGGCPAICSSLVLSPAAWLPGQGWVEIEGFGLGLRLFAFFFSFNLGMQCGESLLVWLNKSKSTNGVMEISIFIGLDVGEPTIASE